MVGNTQLAVAFHPDSQAWYWRSFATLVIGRTERLVFVDINESGGVLHDANNWTTTRDIPTGSALLRPSDSANWEIGCELTHGNSPIQLNVDVDRLVFSNTLPGPARYHRIVYRGLKLQSFTNGVWLRVGDTKLHRYGYTPMTIFGRTALLSTLSEEDNDYLLAVTIFGDWFTDKELDAIDLILQLLAGSSGTRVCVESYDADGRWLQRSYHDIGILMEGRSSPVFFFDQLKDPAFYKAVSSMIEQAKRLNELGLPLRGLLYHVFKSQQRNPELAITHLAIALDGAKSAVIDKIRGEGKLLPQKDFDERIVPVLDAARAAFCKATDAEALPFIIRRIMSANDWSERERWKRFWRDYMKYELDPDERRVLDYRDPAIHNAYLLLTEYDLELDHEAEDRRPYGERLLDLVRDSQIFRNIINRVILTLLCYKGEFCNSVPHGQALVT